MRPAYTFCPCPSCLILSINQRERNSLVQCRIMPPNY